jgi:hypothetical protein
VPRRQRRRGARLEPGEGQQHPDGGQRDQQGRAAEGDEGQRDPGDRQQTDDGAHVDDRLAAQPGGDARGGEPHEQVVGVLRDPDAGVDQDGEQGHHRERAQQAQLLPDDGEDVVGVRLRQPAGPLLLAGAEPLAEQPTGGQRVEALDRLVAGVLGVGERVAEGQQPVHPVRRGHGEEHRSGDEHAHQRGEDAHRRADDPQQRDHDGAHRHGGAEVGLQHDQQQHQGGHRHERDEQVGAHVEQALLAHQQVGSPQHERELRQLGRLQVEAQRQRDPAGRAVDLVADAGQQHRDQQPQRDEQQRVGQRPVEADRHPGGREHQRQSERDEGALLDAGGEQRARGGVGPQAGGGEDHDQAEHQQQQGAGEQQVVGGQRPGQQPRRGAHLVGRRGHASAPTAAANSSPRCA